MRLIPSEPPSSEQSVTKPFALWLTHEIAMRDHLLEVLAWGSGINSTTTRDAQVEPIPTMKGRAIKSPAFNPYVSADHMNMLVSMVTMAQLSSQSVKMCFRLEIRDENEIIC